MSATNFHTTIETPDDYWSAIVVPDYDAYMGHPGDLRYAFHCAIALNHMADWIYVSNEVTINASRTFVDSTGTPIITKTFDAFVKAVTHISPEFGLIRRVANAAKHLELRDKTASPWHSANTGSQFVIAGKHYIHKLFSGEWPRTSRVVIEPNIDFAQTATAVYELWPKLRTQHGW